MGALAGKVGPADGASVTRMLEVVPHRGERLAVETVGPATFGLRTSDGHEVLSNDGRLAVHTGATIPVVTGSLATHVVRGADLDGAFAFADWDGETLTLGRDAFGQRSIYWVEHAGTLWFATELKQLLAIAEIPVEIDALAVHKYLTFSFVPGGDTPIRGIRRVLPGHVMKWRLGGAELDSERWFTLEEKLAPIEQGAAAKRLWQLGREAVQRRHDGGRAGLYLSGGIDSSAVGLWLRELGADVHAFTLDFGPASVEREEADQVAKHLGLPLTVVPVDPADLGKNLDDFLWKLDLPLGDAVTGPHWLLGRAAKAAGLDAVWNGEGGDQLFGGWTSKPMVAAAVYGDGHLDPDDASPEQQYLKSYHKFYGLEGELYAPALAVQVTPGVRRSVIATHLESDRASTFLNRVRLTDLSLKGSQNILPRAERMAAAHGLAVKMPLFDRRLAEWSFTLPTSLKLNGACEKYVFKLALQNRLPDEIVWRRKFGMSVPVTDWVLGPLRARMEDLLSDASVARRGLFDVGFVRALREGQDVSSETRRRRLGERLWALMVLEHWMRRFIDRRGAS